MPRLVRHRGGFRPAHLQGPTPPPAEGEADLHKGVQWICLRACALSRRRLIAVLDVFTSGCSLVRDANTAHGRHATATGKVRQKGFFGGVNKFHEIITHVLIVLLLQMEMMTF